MMRYFDDVLTLWTFIFFAGYTCQWLRSLLAFCHTSRSLGAVDEPEPQVGPSGAVKL